MAAEEAWTCPICREVRKDIAYAVPCRHEFCLGCILRWAKQKETCPLCRRIMTIVKVAEWDEDNELDFIICPPAPPVPACFQAGTAHMYSPQSHAPSPPPFLLLPEEQDDVEEEERPIVGGLLMEVWAALFRQHQEMLDPVLPWLRQELQNIFGTQWREAMATESLILNALCHIGLDSEALIHLLRPALGDRAVTLIQGLVNAIVSQWGEEAHGQRGLQGVHMSRGQQEGPAARGQEDSMVAAPGPAASPPGTETSRPGLNGSTENLIREEQPSIPEAVLDLSHTPAAHIPREQEEPHEEMEQAAASGPSAQGSSPSAPAHSPAGAQRPRKRRAGTDLDPQQPCKKPPPRKQ
ncbi:E3 ubiquitin-protein ligase Topors-like [Meleagris gallopavo]|uniref:E3 ubiquitin-protein ligase Topors-like n=1 Tax=Meleagris gallopavo TaxID=9103 RepID=UPI00093BC6BF|nr:E3 ubiquitin-protein ligase Topors-like [Meleagris gallopavo]